MSTTQPSSVLRLARRECWTLVALVLACRAISLWALPLADSAFVTFRYARNLGQGFGLVYNPGEPWEPVIGTSSPAYAGLLAPFLRLGCDPTWLAPALALGCEFASACMLLLLFERRRCACAVALFGFALLPALNRGASSGTEAPLFTALALGAVLTAQRARWRTSGTLVTLASLLRPEGLMLALVLAGRALRLRTGLRRFASPLAAGLALVTLAVLAAGLLPQSLRGPVPLADPEGGSWSLERIASLLGQVLAPASACLPLLPLVLLGLWLGLRSGSALALLSLAVLLILALQIATGARAEPWNGHVLHATWCVWGGLGAEALLVRHEGRFAADALTLVRQRVVVFGAPVLLLAFGATAAARRDPIRERVQAPLQRWARAIGRVEPRARILASDVGMLGWAWSGTVYDSEGRVWPPARLYVQPNAMIRELWPEYLLINADSRRLAPFYGDAELRERYVPVARFAWNGASELEPPTTRLPAAWVPDYLLFRRSDFVDALAR